MTRKYFGTDGIRGQANQFPMTADMAMKTAMASAIALRETLQNSHVQGNEHTDSQTQNRVVIGKDTRLSGYMFEQAMTAGFVAMGMDVVLLGPIPTPAVAMLTRSLRADLGVMISASHNPYHDNGIKLFGADGYKLADETERKIESLIDKDMSDYLASPEKMGRASRLDDASGRYIEFIKSTVSRNRKLNGLKVVVDCAHGAAYRVAPKVLWELEAEVIAIGVQPNGKNINDKFGATDTENLSKSVLDHNADIGIALDGDADRLIIVDEKGEVVDGDQILALLALHLQEKDELRQNGVVATVMSNLGFEKFLQSKNIQLIRSQVGDRYVVEDMRRQGFCLGGEQSGHIVMSDFGTTGDGLMAALQILSILSQKDQPISELAQLYPKYPQILKNVSYEKGATNPLDLDDIQQAIQAAQDILGQHGRVLVRASGTQPLIRVMAEGDNIDQVNHVVNDLCDKIKDCA